MQSKKELPLKLNITELVLANLGMLERHGFEIQHHFFKNQAENVLYPYWIAKKKDAEHANIVFFFPSKDTRKTYDDIIGMDSMPYLLDTQKVAEYYVQKGFTCVIPLSECEPMKIFGQSTAIDSVFNFFASKTINENEKSPLSRQHWTVLLWNEKDVKAFDPKSSKAAYLLKYDNGTIKEFVKETGREIEGKKLLGLVQIKTEGAYYHSVKEEHPQGTLDFNNCGYYCSFRIEQMVKNLLNNAPIESIPSQAFPKEKEMKDNVGADMDLAREKFYYINISAIEYYRKKELTETNPEYFTIIPLKNTSPTYGFIESNELDGFERLEILEEIQGADDQNGFVIYETTRYDEVDTLIKAKKKIEAATIELDDDDGCQTLLNP